MISVPIIAVLVYGLIELLELAFKKYENFANFVPLLAGLIGGVLSIVTFYAAPSIIAVTNVIYAFASGFMSGLVSTGSDQVVSKLTSLYKNTHGNDEKK